MNVLLGSTNLYSAANKMLLPFIFTPNSLSNAVCLQCVRWRKKPRWLPVAKTKLFRIPQRRQYPPEENAEVLHLFNDYRTKMKAIRYFLSEETKRQTTAPEVIAEQLHLEDEENARCFKLNEEWNKEVARIREKRVIEDSERKRLQVLEEVEEYKRKEEETLEHINQIVRLEKEKSKTFITPENIDAAIEKALAETVDFNFCIDLDGNIYEGLRARPGVSEPINKKIGDDSRTSVIETTDK